jgi:hypothetical protein
MALIGRIREIKELDRLLASKEAEFLALYGRRRVGKTFLVREHLKNQLCFELTGIKDAPLKEQLAIFHQQLSERSGKARPLPESWQEAFQQLAGHLGSLRGSGKRVVFLDELPWLECGWVHRPNETWSDGTQVDLLIDRADNTINLIEIKFSQGAFTITKGYAAELRRKVAVFKGVTATRKNVFLTFLTTHGIAPNAYAKELVQTELTTDCLFGEAS